MLNLKWSRSETRKTQKGRTHILSPSHERDEPGGSEGACGGRIGWGGGGAEAICGDEMGRRGRTSGNSSCAD